MKVILLALPLVLLVAYCAWNLRLKLLWAWLGARPAGQFPVWKQVSVRLEELSRRERLPVPALWILPEFSPNALILKSRGGVEIALSEGLLRSLEAAELDAVLVLCLAHGHRSRRRMQTLLSLLLFPVARWLQGLPAAFQLLLSPSLTFLLRLASPQAGVLSCDSKVSRRREEALAVAAALQKMAVLGRKIPLKQWNFALDPLFLVSPLTLDGAPFWLFLSQPSVELRRERLLGYRGGSPCESVPSLP
jgi:Zn-dependent protease with chaperone function